MAAVKKQDNNKKKDQGKKEAGSKGASGKVQVLSKEKREPVKKDAVKKDVVVKKDRAVRFEQVRKFFRGTLNELKKVHWPNRREVTIYTAVVLVAVVAVGAMIWLFDSVLSTILRLTVFK